jgi:hypothetical protein
MSFITSHRAVLESIGDKQMKVLLQDILNNNYYLKDFTKDQTTILMLETLEIYGFAFVSNKEERVILTPTGESVLYYLNQKKCLIDETKELYDKLEAWEKCAENLVDYAHDFVHQLSLWGKGYDRNDKQIKLAEDAIEEYNRLKNKNE